MNKKLLAAAVAAAVVAAPAAFAESTVYGKFHTSIDSNDFEDGSDNYTVKSRSSRIGFKGSEDLGGGLKAIYQAEFSVQTDGNDGGNGQDGGDGWGGQRNTFIGLSGGFGTFLVGRHDTPTKIAFYGAGNERLGDSIIDLNPGGNAPIGVFTEYRADNAIAYVSPSFSGFTFAAAVIPGEECDSGDTRGTCASSGDHAADGIADHFSLGLIYKGNGVRASIGYEEFDNQGRGVRIAGNRNLDDLDITGQGASIENADIEVLQIGASYTMNNFSIGAHWQDTDIDEQGAGTALAGSDVEYTAWAITGKATFGNNAISLVWTDSETEVDGSEAFETTGWGVAAEHNFSKRTKAYVAYASNEEDVSGGDDNDDDVFSLGMIHNF